MHLTSPDAGSAAVWVRWAPVDSAAEGELDEVERARVAALSRVADQQRFRTSRAALKSLVAGLVDVAPADVRLDYTCARCGRQHGRPVVTQPAAGRPWHVSIAHSGAWVLVAASDAGPVGVDVEQVDGTLFDGFERTALTPGERLMAEGLPAAQRRRAQAQLWATKEALLKATGQGLSRDPSGFDVLEAQALPGVHVRPLPAGAQHVAAVALLSGRPCVWHLPPGSGPG